MKKVTFNFRVYFKVAEAKEAQARPRLSKRSLRIANKLEKPSERLTKHTKQQMRELQMRAIANECWVT